MPLRQRESLAELAELLVRTALSLGDEGNLRLSGPAQAAMRAIRIRGVPPHE